MPKVETTATGNVTATVSRGSGKALEDVSIKPSKNGGFVMSASYRETEKKKKGGMLCCPSGWTPPETYTYESFDSLVTGLKKCFGVK